MYTYSKNASNLEALLFRGEWNSRKMGMGQKWKA